MERTPLLYFLEVCRTGSIVRAGRSLRVTPQAVAKGIRQLEAELGYPLLERTPSGSTPTVRGREVFSIGERMERFQSHALEQMHALAAQSDAPSTVHLGMWSNFMQVMPATLISDFTQLHPEITMSIHTYTDYGQCEHDICTGDIDVGLGFHTYDEELLEPLHIHRSNLYAIVSSSHRLAGQRRISLDDLRNENLIVERITEHDTAICGGYPPPEDSYQLETVLREKGIAPQIILPFMNETPKRAMVLEGEYVAFCLCPKSWLPYGITVLDIEDVNYRGESSFLKARGFTPRPAVRKYLDFILPRFRA